MPEELIDEVDKEGRVIATHPKSYLKKKMFLHRVVLIIPMAGYGRYLRFLRKEFPELLKMPTLWTHSYFISTAGNVSASVIKKYIEQQWDKV